jgi:hypothetical protein
MKVYKGCVCQRLCGEDYMRETNESEGHMPSYIKSCRRMLVYNMLERVRIED